MGTVARRALDRFDLDLLRTRYGETSKLTEPKTKELITSRLLDQANALLVVGNDAVLDGLKISEQDAELTVQVMRHVLESLYEVEKIAET